MRVSRKIRNMMRRERRANPTLEMIFARRKSETPEKRRVRERAEDLWREYHSNGASWAACVQAVKTDWISQFINKYRGAAKPAHPASNKEMPR
jgi:hypothetical protein